MDAWRWPELDFDILADGAIADRALADQDRPRPSRGEGDQPALRQRHAEPLLLAVAATQDAQRRSPVERLLLELKGKLGADLGHVGGAPHTDASVDVTNALLALGYSDKEAALAMKQVPAGTGVSEGIKLALKALSKG